MLRCAVLCCACLNVHAVCSALLCARVRWWMGGAPGGAGLPAYPRTTPDRRRPAALVQPHPLPLPQELHALCSASAALEVCLPGGGSDVVTLAPLTRAGAVLFAPIGLVGMLNPGGAVLSYTVTGGGAWGGRDRARAAALPPARRACCTRPEVPRLLLLVCGRAGDEAADGAPPAFAVRLKGSGEFLCYASHRPAGVSVDGASCGFEYSGAGASLLVRVPPGGPAERECAFRF